MVQESIDVLWQEISKVDSIGRSQIMETCGGTELEQLLFDARTLAKLLTSIRRSLDSTSLSVSCPRINPIYVSLVHDTICTEVASASARGFIFFLVLGIAMMTMVSLRAAWLRIVPEEKVYHDAIDIAENMVLDEHEEYLRYISKYKHEWEEYRGFDGNGLEPPYHHDDEERWSSAPGSSSYIDDFVDDDHHGPSYEKESDFEQGSVQPGSLGEEEDLANNHGHEGEEGYAFEPADVASPSGFQVVIVQAGEGATYSAHERSIGKQAVIRHDSLQDIQARESTTRPPPQNPFYNARAAPRRTKSSASLPTRTGTSFFDKYGIEPGQSARAKGVGPSSPRPTFDPPAERLSLGRLPSGRPFYKANSTEYGEVEIELENSGRSKSWSGHKLDC
jgi:hypothetical protein